jgi:uncharacterized membrane protein (DUF485 family)
MPRNMAKPFDEVARREERKFGLIITLIFLVVMIALIIVLAGALQCSPLSGGGVCEGSIVVEGFKALKSLFGF